MPNCYTCQEEIIFDKNVRSKTGKQIPLWPDRKNAHGHDDQGNPIRQPLPIGTGTIQQQKPPMGSFQEITPTDIPKTSQGGLPLDTKRLLQAVVELTKEVRDFRQEIKTMIQEVTIVDTARYENQISWIYDKIPEEQKDKDFKSAKEYHDQLTKPIIDPVTTNHAKIAEDKQNFMQRKQDRVPNKFVDESKQEKQTFDERIPDNNEEFAIEQALKDDEGVIDED